MEKIQQYRMRVGKIMIYSLATVPKAGEKFRISDARLRYEIDLSEPYVITYIRDVNEDGTYVTNERLSVTIRGRVLQKQQTLLQGDTLLILDNNGGYVIVYRIKDGTSHFMNDDVTILLEGMCVEEREEGDQLLVLYVPDHYAAYKITEGIEEIISK